MSKRKHIAPGGAPDTVVKAPASPDANKKARMALPGQLDQLNQLNQTDQTDPTDHAPTAIQVAVAADNLLWGYSHGGLSNDLPTIDTWCNEIFGSGIDRLINDAKFAWGKKMTVKEAINVLAAWMLVHRLL